MATVAIHRPPAKHHVARVTAVMLRRRFREGDRAPCHRTERLADDPREPAKVFCPEGGELYLRTA